MYIVDSLKNMTKAATANSNTIRHFGEMIAGAICGQGFGGRWGCRAGNLSQRVRYCNETL